MFEVGLLDDNLPDALNARASPRRQDADERELTEGNPTSIADPMYIGEVQLDATFVVPEILSNSQRDCAVLQINPVLNAGSRRISAPLEI
ncbi:MAG TPA: hypothetical protein VG406_22885 [Isosphaeraceae bacterium]|nr:hypothetical protein [Isosphaeraceae bacterium]